VHAAVVRTLSALALRAHMCTHLDGKHQELPHRRPCAMSQHSAWHTHPPCPCVSSCPQRQRQMSCCKSSRQASISLSLGPPAEIVALVREPGGEVSPEPASLPSDWLHATLPRGALEPPFALALRHRVTSEALTFEMFNGFAGAAPEPRVARCNETHTGCYTLRSVLRAKMFG